MEMEIEQFSEDAIKAGKLFERLHNEQKAAILAFLRALDEDEINVSVSDNPVL